jgi:hypothetical protein
MRFVAAIVCSLLLLRGQFAVASATCAGTAKRAGNSCHCGGKMSCCAAKPVQSPVPANNSRASFQNQIVSPVPTVVVSIFTPAGIPAIYPTVSPAETAGAAPIFARHCARLI